MGLGWPGTDLGGAGVGWQATALLEERAGRPEKAECLRLEHPEGPALIHHFAHSFIHSFIHQTLSKGKSHSKHFLDTNHGHTFQGGLDLLVLHYIFAGTLRGSEYYFHPTKAEKNQVSEWEGDLLKGSS